MAVTVEVLYDDLSIVIKPIAQLNTLQKDKILIMLFKKDGFNIISLMGFDQYYVKYAGGILQYVQFDDEDGAVHLYDLNQNTEQTDRIHRDQGWIPANFIHFEGLGVSTDIWNQALNIFENQMTNSVV